MKQTFFSLLFILTFSVLALSQNAEPKVYVAPMDEGFHTFITASLIREKVPVTVTADEAEADFIITGNSVKGNNKWYDTVFGSEKDRNQGSIQMIRVSDKSVVWAGSAGDKSFWFNEFKKGGKQKVADRLAKRMKKEYFKGAQKSRIT